MCLYLGDKRYLGHILATFLGGFLTAHLVFRLRSTRAGKQFTVEAPKHSKFGKQESTQTDSSNSAPATPAACELKPRVTFEDGVKETGNQVNGYCCLPAPESAFSTAAAQKARKKNPLALGVIPSPASSESSDAGADSDEEQIAEMTLSRNPSGIPTDIHLPELVFGEQIPNGKSCYPLPVLPFSTYAPCRVLDVKPNSPEHGQIFEGIRTIAAYYLRAESPAICECIQTFGLNDLLFSIARLECIFKETLRSGNRKGNSPDRVTSIIAKAAKQVIAQKPQSGPKGTDEVEAVRGVVAALMHELECILHEYLSFNWDRVDEIYEANKHLLREEGLVCFWKSVSISSFSSTPSIAGTSPRTWDRDSSASGSYSNLVDLDQPSSPGSDRSTDTPYETFDEYMAKVSSRSNSVEYVRKQLESTQQSEPDNEAETNFRQSGSSATPADHAGARQSSSAATGTSGRTAPGETGTPSGKTRKPPRTSNRALKNWKRAKAAVTRKITEDMLGPQRRFLTLRQMFEDLNRGPEQSVSSQRQPIILLLGGGMAAGKSTVREIIGRDGFWSKVGKDAVVVEADAIKNRDLLYRSLSRMDFLDRDGELRQHLHEYSTKAAEILLVAAVNQQKDVVFDGTMTWAPFVQQTIAMVRDHRHNYRRGPGFFVDSEGNTFERYWEIDEDNPVVEGQKKPYRIELVGVTCDTGLAVARGVWRKIRTGRSVPVPSQLRSHRLFAENFETFAGLVDSATLYHTGCALTTFNKGGVDLSPKVIAHRSSYTRGELLINPSAYKSFKQKVHINDKATCRQDLYGTWEPCDGKIPTTQEDQMSTLRHVFRAADKRERKALRKQPIPRRNSFW